MIAAPLPLDALGRDELTERQLDAERRATQPCASANFDPTLDRWFSVG